MNMNKKKYDKKTDKLKIEVVQNGLILPRTKTEQVEDIRWGLGGVLDAQDSFVQSSFYDGGWAKHGGYYEYDGNQIEFLDEDVVYFGLFFSHWGHFLIDCITRAWYIFELAKERDDFKVAYLGEEVPSGNNLRFFELLGIKPDQLFHIEKPTRCRNVIVPEQGFKSCEWYSQEHLDMFDGMIDSSLHSDIDFSSVCSFEKIYFTRRSFAKAIDSEFGEKYLERTFLLNEYKAVSPERLTLDEQIYIWNHASSICCVNGSIPLNVLFARNPELELIILNKTSLFHENPLILLQMRKLSQIFIDVFSEPIHGYPKSLGEGPFLFAATVEFKVFCRQRNWKMPQNTACEIMYFLKERIKYLISLTGIKRRFRLLLSKSVPDSLKSLLKKAILHN